MRVEGDATIRAGRETVWKFITDPHSVSRCAPGVDSLEILVPDQKFRATVSIGFGTVKVSLVTDVEWLELDELNRAKVKIHGVAPGSAVDATSEMSLVDGPDGATGLKWWADVMVSGSIASMASRLMASVTQTLTAAFFDCVRKQIEV